MKLSTAEKFGTSVDLSFNRANCKQKRYTIRIQDIGKQPTCKDQIEGYRICFIINFAWKHGK